MRKITLFSSLLCALLFSTSAMGRSMTGLENKGVVSIGTTPVTTLAADKWYVMECQGNYAYDNGTGLWSASKASLMTVGSLTSTCAKVLFTVVDPQTSTSVTEDGKTGDVTAYKIKWGTGRYTKWPRNASNEVVFNRQILTTDEITGADYVYVAKVADDNNRGYVRFAQNTNTVYGGSNDQAVPDSKNTLFDKNVDGKISNWSGSSKLVAPEDNLGGNGKNADWRIYEVTLADLKDVTVKAVKEGAPTYTANVKLPVGTGINVVEFLAANGLLEYDQTTTTNDIDNSTSEVTIEYTNNAIPFAASYEELGEDEDDNKWISLYTYNGRMFVYDATSETNNRKYPCIDKATFTNLTDRKFWGFICENPLTDYVKIVNKGAGKEKGTLYLTANGKDKALLLATVQGSNVTNEWIIEKSTKPEVVATGDDYYGIKAKGTNLYINNYWGKGFMTTNSESANQDPGSNIKFTSEKDTYETLKERAFTVPAGAVHSLNDAARTAIQSNTNNTIEGYKALIRRINDTETNEGFIQFQDGGYYYLRNYTPANGKTYVLDSKNGTSATTSEVSATLANSETMNYTNINAIWKITTDPDNPAVSTGSDDIGVSKTIGRFVTHVNSGKKLTDGGTRTLAEAGATYYFVNLGAGQHFLKNTQYTGTGQQASAAPLRCDNNGTLGNGGGRHLKNSRDAWYGIQVTTIDVTIGATGYATIYLPFGVNVPKDSELKVYAVTDAADGVATLTEVTSVPAKQGVILQGTANTAYTLNIDDAAGWTIENNKLSGSCMTSYVAGEAYVLATTTENGVGLYKTELNKNEDGTDNETGTHFQNNSNKAYLPATAIQTGESARFLSFDFGTETGLDVIKVAESASKGAAVYDLSGRRVQNAQKGLYIVNGKKVVK